MRVPPRPASALYSDRAVIHCIPAPSVLFLLSFGIFPRLPDVFHPDFIAVFLPFCRFYAVILEYLENLVVEMTFYFLHFFTARMQIFVLLKIV